MKVQLFLWLTVLILLASCTGNNQSKDGIKLLDYKYFTIRVPKNWKRVDVRGIDSFVGRIDIDSTTSIGFNLGWYCETLSEGRRTKYYNDEGEDIFIPDSSIKQNLDDPTHWKYFGKADSNTVKNLRRNRAIWVAIDHYKAKLITPKKVGIGTTGIYIDSLWKTGDNADGFVLSADNLTAKEQQQLITAIRTLKFYQHPSK
jgi:hypothetical protein